jgi:translation initiation factor 4E
MASELKQQEGDYTPDPQDHSMRHPLQHTWTMYYDPPMGKQKKEVSWKDNVKKVLAFNTVEDFWWLVSLRARPRPRRTGVCALPRQCALVAVSLSCPPRSMYNNLRKPTELTTGSNYHLFKEDIFPEWEDARNVKGGKWVFTPRAGQDLDEIWLNTVRARGAALFAARRVPEAPSARLTFRVACIRFSP